MPETLGFWSYVHADDQADFNLISELARDIARRYELIRNESIELFLDRDDLAWGDRWRDRIDETLSNVAFFVPVLTPRYFASTECRREFEFFLNRSKSLGIEALVLPVLYETVPGLLDDEIEDPLMRFVRESNWRDWRELRFEDRPSGAYRRAVHELASEIARRAQEVEAVDIVAAVAAAEERGELEEPPGTLDAVADLETTIPKWGTTLEEVTAELTRIAEIMQVAASDTQTENSQGKGFAARLVIARRVATELEGPTEAIERLVGNWLDSMETIDRGLRVFVRMIADDASVNAEDAEGFFAVLDGLAVASRENLSKSMVMVEQLDVLARQSRDLRPVVQRLREPLVALAEATKVTDEWANLRPF